MLSKAIFFLAGTIFFSLSVVTLMEKNSSGSSGHPTLGAANTEITIYVVGAGESIQEAVDSAVAGDTILLESDDTYVESVTVDKTLTIAAGDDYSPTVKGLPAEPAFTIPKVNGVSIVLTLNGLIIEASDRTYNDDPNLNQYGDMFSVSGNTLSRANQNALIVENSVIKDSYKIYVRDGSGTTLRHELIDSTVEGRLTFDGLGPNSGTTPIVDIILNNTDIEILSLVGSRTNVAATVTDSTVDLLYVGGGYGKSQATVSNSTIDNVYVTSQNGEATALIENSTIIRYSRVLPTQSGEGELTIKHSILGHFVQAGAEEGTPGSDAAIANIFIEDSLIANSDVEYYSFAGLHSAGIGQIEAKNVTVSGFKTGIHSNNSSDTFTNMLLVNNDVDLGMLANTDSISYSLISDGGIPGVVGVNNNISGVPLLDEQFNLLPGSPGIDAGDDYAISADALDVNGLSRLQDGDGDGIAQIDMGAFELQATMDETVDEKDSGNIDASDPHPFNSWGSGFNATYEYEVQPSDTDGGALERWRIEIGTGSDFFISNAWVNDGYNAGIQTFLEADNFVLSNENESYIDDLSAGDIIKFTIQGYGGDFDSNGLTLNFTALTQRPIAESECTNPVVVSLPFSFDGQGEFCWEISTEIDYVNSWNTNSVNINDEGFANRWSNSLPERVDGKYTVLYNGLFPWSHFEASGSK